MKTLIVILSFMCSFDYKQNRYDKLCLSHSDFQNSCNYQKIIFIEKFFNIFMIFLTSNTKIINNIQS